MLDFQIVCEKWKNVDADCIVLPVNPDLTPAFQSEAAVFENVSVKNPVTIFRTGDLYMRKSLPVPGCAQRSFIKLYIRKQKTPADSVGRSIMNPQFILRSAGTIPLPFHYCLTVIARMHWRLPCVPSLI